MKPEGCEAENKVAATGNNKSDRKLRLNKNGFSLFAKVCRDGAEVTCSGRQ